MPRGDGTGPMGMGSQTGRALGYCAGYGMAGYQQSPGRRGREAGYGRGRGRGMGYQRWPDARIDPARGSRTQEDVALLKNREAILRTELDGIRKRIDALEQSEK